MTLQRDFPRSFLYGNLEDRPSTGTIGQFFLDTGSAVSKLYYWSGTAWRATSISGSSSEPLDVSVIAGNGLTGGGVLSSDVTLNIDTPGTLTVSTTNSASSNHTHEITASANPGAATSILKSDSNGYLQLVRLGLGAAPSYALHVAGQGYVNVNSATAFVVEQGGVKDNALVVDTTNGRVGIGATPGATLDVRGSAVFNEAGADVDFRVEGDNNANLIVTDATYDTVGIGVAASQYQRLYTSKTFTETTNVSGQLATMQSVAALNPGAASDAVVYGGKFYVSSASGYALTGGVVGLFGQTQCYHTGALTSAYALNFSASNHAAGTVASMYGVNLGMTNVSGSGQITQAYGVNITTTAGQSTTIATARGVNITFTRSGSPAGAITNAYAVYVNAFASNGTNNYGLYIGDITGATTNRAITTNAGVCLFNAGGDASSDFIVYGDTDTSLLVVDASADRVGFGTSGPDAKADILTTSGAQLRLTYTDGSVYSDFTVGSGGNLTIAPTGDLIFNPAGNDVLPETGYDINLGSLEKKYLKLHAAELWVETLVAQETIATVGGRVLVGPTTTLTRDLSDAAVTIYVKHNEASAGDMVYLEASGKVEFIQIDSAATAEAEGDYSYDIIRNVDGSGANAWYAGDAVFNTGAADEGFIDIYSVHGVKASTQYGPTIVGNIRNSTTSHDDWTEAWAIGNLDGLYGYGTTTFGVAFGKYSEANYLTIDSTNGVRFFDSDDHVQAQLSSTTWTLGYTTGGEYVSISADGIEMFSNSIKVVDIANNGDFIFGQVATDKPNLFWDESEGKLFFRGGTDGLDAPVWISTAGAVVCGDGDVVLDEYGLTITQGSSTWNNVKWTDGTDYLGAVGVLTSGGENRLQLLAYYDGTNTGRVSMFAYGTTSTTDSAGVIAAGGATNFVALQLGEGVTAGLTLFSDKCNLSGVDLRVAKGLYVGGVATDPGDGEITATSTIRSNTGFNVNGTAGLASQVVTLAKVTTGGSNGSITITGGIVTAYTAPT